MKKDFLSLDDYTPEQLKRTITLAERLKKSRKPDRISYKPLNGMNMGMLFEKPSLRTRVTFELAMVELGGHAVEAQPSGTRLGKRESIADVARNLERFVDLVVARVYSNATLHELAGHMDNVPVVNALCDLEHPCQAIADLLTMRELVGDSSDTKLTYVGDGNNVCHSLMLGCAMLGMTLGVATPAGFEPGTDFIRRARTINDISGGKLEITTDPVAAVKAADFVYTDVWASMGQEDEVEQRRKIFMPYQVNAKLVAHAKDSFYLLHCLPAHRDEEVTAELVDGPHSRVFDQAENRLHAQKAVILQLLAPAEAEKVLEDR